MYTATQCRYRTGRIGLSAVLAALHNIHGYHQGTDSYAHMLRSLCDAVGAVLQ